MVSIGNQTRQYRKNRVRGGILGICRLRLKANEPVKNQGVCWRTVYTSTSPTSSELRSARVLTRQRLPLVYKGSIDVDWRMKGR